MNNLIANIGHIVTAVLVDAAAVILALHGNISGESALVVIAGVSGFSLGGSVASSPGSPVTPTATTTSPASVPADAGKAL